MNQKLVFAALCSSLLLSACGSDNADDNSHIQSSHNIDYSNTEHIDWVLEPVTSLTLADNNSLLEVVHIAEDIHYNVMDPNYENNSVTCKSGSIAKNKDESIRLNNCQSLRINGKSYDGLDDAILSGTITSKVTENKNTEQYEVTLDNFSIKDSDGEVSSYHGKSVVIYKDIDRPTATAEFIIDKMLINWLYGKEKEQHIISNYRLNETYNSETTIAKGRLEGHIEGKTFLVNFDSALKTKNYGAAIDNALINIQDYRNKKNSIIVESDIQGKALIRAYSNGIAITPRTAEWSDYYY